MQNGFIIIPRAIENCDVLQDMDALGFYTMLMRSLRFRETFVDGVEVGVNQLLISKPELAKRCNLTVAKVRRMLREFQEVGGISCQNIKNKYTLITFLEPFLYTSASDKGKTNPPAAVLQTEDVRYDIETAPDENINRNSDEADAHEGGELRAYGRFHNVYLTEDEYMSLKRDYPITDKVLEKLSSFLKDNPGKNTANSCAQLYRWILNEKDWKTDEKSTEIRSSNIYGNPVIKPDPNASYDLKRAEERAKRTVPEMKKRDRW